ncbi:MAG: hypothetical protein KDD84_12065, partial [Caldilineaceae bacterium]|nr:hypothetical protein [Caldilineaceae bacterium]
SGVFVGSGIGVLVGVIGAGTSTPAAGAACPAPTPTNKRAVGTQPAKISAVIANAANDHSFDLRTIDVNKFVPFCATAKLNDQIYKPCGIVSRYIAAHFERTTRSHSLIIKSLCQSASFTPGEIDRLCKIHENTGCPPQQLSQGSTSSELRRQKHGPLIV